MRVTAFCFIVMNLLAGGAPHPQEGNVLFEQVAPWLPSDTEVVYDSNVSIKGLVSSTNEEVIDHYSRWAAAAIGELNETDQATEPLRELDATGSVYAGRRFRLLGTPGLGLAGRFEGCSFFRVNQNAAARVIRFLDSRKEQLLLRAGLYRLTTRAGGPTAAALAIPEPDVLMACSDRQLAEEILARKDARLPRIAFQDEGLPGEFADSQSLVWGFRHFTHNATDVTSPLRGAPRILPNYSDAKAVAMFFVLESSTRARVVYITKNPKSASMYEKVWGGKGSSMPTARQGKWAITLQFDPSRDPGDRMEARVLLLLLGVLVVV
jgi:hypothetical protein